MSTKSYWGRRNLTLAATEGRGLRTPYKGRKGVTTQTGKKLSAKRSERTLAATRGFDRGTLSVRDVFGSKATRTANKTRGARVNQLNQLNVRRSKRLIDKPNPIFLYGM